MTTRKRKQRQVAEPVAEVKEVRSQQSNPGIISKLFFILAVFLAVIAVYNYRTLYLLRRIAKKSSLDAVDIHYNEQAWGTYRSHMYFGLRTQQPQSPLFGMIWYPQKGMQLTINDVRHWCEKDNGVKKYAYTHADGRTFGNQVIQDNFLNIRTAWLNNGSSWTAQITTTSVFKMDYAFLFYFAFQDPESALSLNYDDGHLFSVSGNSPVSDNFDIHFRANGQQQQTLALLYQNPYPDAAKILETVFKNTIFDDNKILRLVNTTTSIIDEIDANLFITQFNIQSNVSIEISYSADGYMHIEGSEFEKMLEERMKKFERRFDKIFKLKEKGYSEMHEQMGMFALSNMLGTIGYNFGYNRVRGEKRSETTLYGPHELLSACPCRSTFPRGFLWDEGFHNLLIRKFDPKLSLKIIGSWLNTMNIDGWIPREMILGTEAELRVPSEFIVQTDKTANPPMFMFLIQQFLNDRKFISTNAVKILKTMYPRLAVWYKWLNTTQAGQLYGTYRWRGRNVTTESELNPKTLASGFDDYPRATHPSDQEYHLDIRCWMALSAKVLSKLAGLVGDTAGRTVYEDDERYLSDLNTLSRLHWSRRKKRFCDFGLHSTSVALKDTSLLTRNGNLVRNSNGEVVVTRLRVVNKTPQLQLVEDAFGYVSLFPMILRLLPHNSAYLQSTLNTLRSDKELWTAYGLRSLSKSSPYYRQWNTKDDPPYWRGNIWMNMNYMVLSSLKYYSQFSGPNKELVHSIYAELRNNVVQNVLDEFNRTGTLWEHYDDRTGKGGGAYPFTGWSSLVLAIMAEQYD